MPSAGGQNPQVIDWAAPHQISSVRGDRIGLELFSRMSLLGAYGELFLMHPAWVVQSGTVH